MEKGERQTGLLSGASAQVLRIVCHGLHMALVFYALLGWLVPSAPWLIAHLIFIPALIAVWVVNRGTCPLNNVESRLTTGKWRDPENREEGSFIVTVVERYLGLQPTQRQMDFITYALMALVWLASLIHLWLLDGIPS